MIERALAPFLAFPRALRGAHFAAAPEQIESFLAAIDLLGPHALADIRRAAHAVFGPGPERHQEFDAVFDSVFLGRAFAAPMAGDPQDLPQAYDAAGFDLEPETGEDEPSGQEASLVERLFARALAAGDRERALLAFRRALPAALPRRRSRRLGGRRGRLADPARIFRQLARQDGELARLPRRRRLPRQRRVLMLIDVSGSMKAGTDGALALAH
ncbi:MAG: VWA domain-containing protein, partial [Methylobacteriaceae bacterium]|nr:VWA domain-containing protein [Methylobacteriaceae bacterium]